MHDHPSENEPAVSPTSTVPLRWRIIGWMIDIFVGMTLTGVGLTAGWYAWHESPRGHQTPPEAAAASVTDVFEVLSSIGLECAQPILIDRRRSKVEARCSEPQFDILLTPDQPSASEAYDLALSVLCAHLINTDGRRWYLFTFTRWTLLTFDGVVADEVGGLVTARATAMDCDWEREQQAIRA